MEDVLVGQASQVGSRRVGASEEMLIRVEHAIAQQNVAYSQTRDEVLGLKKDQDNLRSGIAALAESIRTLADKFEQSQKMNWPVMIGILSLVPILVGGAIYVISGQISGAISPLNTSITAMTTEMHSVGDRVRSLEVDANATKRDVTTLSLGESTTQAVGHRMEEQLSRLAEASLTSQQADANSRTDRQQLNDRMKTQERMSASSNADRRAAVAAIDAKLVEVETQFKGLQTAMNIQFANQLRYNSLVWEKTHPGERYPDAVQFYPQMFQEAPAGSVLGPPGEPRGDQ